MFMCTQARDANKHRETETYMQTRIYRLACICFTHTLTKTNTQKMDHKGQHVGDEPFMF